MADNEILLKPGQRIKPSVTEDDVKRVLLELYNLEVSSIKELNSYDDRNFFVKTKAANTLPNSEDECAEGYIFKVLNSLDSKSSGLVDAQNQMMLYLGNFGIPCPRPVRNVYGNLMSDQELEVQSDQATPDKEKHIVRLLTYVPGEIFFTVPYTKELFYQIGEMTAKIDLALSGFHHESLAKVDRIWNLSAVPKLKQFLYAVSDDDNRLMASRVIANFEERVVPAYPRLAKGPIHGDLNEQNVLVKRENDANGGYVVSGVIDFGDIHTNYYVFELAIAVCYMMIECKTMDILDAPGHVLAGYNAKRPIPDDEFSILKDCIAGRFCQSLVLGAYSYSLNPDPYLLTTSKNGWTCLRKLWDAPNEELCKRWKAIMSTYDQ